VDVVVTISPNVYICIYIYVFVYIPQFLKAKSSSNTTATMLCNKSPTKYAILRGLIRLDLPPWHRRGDNSKRSWIWESSPKGTRSWCERCCNMHGNMETPSKSPSHVGKYTSTMEHMGKWMTWMTSQPGAIKNSERLEMWSPKCPKLLAFKVFSWSLGCSYVWEHFTGSLLISWENPSG